MVRRLCSARRTNGEPCKGLAMKGQKVCRVHGGKAPQSLAAAKLRLAALVDPAIGVLAYAMEQKTKQLPSAIVAARDALDRTGYKVVEVVRVETSASARVLAAVLSMDELLELRERLQRAQQVESGPVAEIPTASVEATDDAERSE